MGSPFAHLAERMGQDRGPRVMVSISCWNCQHLLPFVSSGWGSEASSYCAKLDRHLDTIGLSTPTWCPYLPSATAEWEPPAPPAAAFKPSPDIPCEVCGYCHPDWKECVCYV